MNHFEPNLQDDLHCLQACYVMVWDRLTGRRVTLAEAEIATGFVSGWPTWQFAMLASFQSSGFYGVDVEAFATDSFLADPEGTIRLQVGDDATAKLVLDAMDVSAEVSRLREALESGVRFVNRSPDLADLAAAVELGGVVMCNVNSRPLTGDDGYEGHLVLVEEMSEANVRLQDPGLPARQDVEVSGAVFETAWKYPTPSMANCYVIFRDTRSRDAFIGRFT